MTGAGTWRVEAFTTATYVRSAHTQACPDIGPVCDEGPVTPYRHRNTIALVESLVEAELGLAERWAVSATLPLRWARLGVRYETLDGEPYPDPPDEGIHHRNETLVGPGDPVISLRAGRGRGPVAVAGRAGVSLPFGWTQPNPFALGRSGQAHQHLQFGAGIFQPVLGAEVLAPIGPVDLSAASSATLALYQNTWGLRPASHAQLTVEGGRRLGDGIIVAAGATLAREWAERWSEAQPDREGNLGRTDLLVGARVRLRAGDSLTATAGASVPLFTDAVGSSIHYPGTILLGLTWVAPTQ